jgi:ferredoxin-NADP reductase
VGQRGGGSASRVAAIGIVPLMAMVRQRSDIGAGVPCTLLYSSRTVEDIIYADELGQLSTQ